MNRLCRESGVSANNKRKKVKMMRELVKGHEAATKLKLLLQNPIIINASSDSESEELVANVLRSFTHTLSLLTASNNNSSSSEQGGCGTDDAQNILEPNSGEDPSSNKRSLTPATKNNIRGRGCYQRRRTEETWTIVSHTADDNHAWRKYGQKEILNSKFPRSYFRCSRKYDEGCRAMKQVQRIQENPNEYLTLYIGTHTCKSTATTTKALQHLVKDSIPNSESSFLVNSHHHDSKVLNEQNQPIIISSTSPTIKQEHSKEDISSDDVTCHKLDPSLWSDLKDIIGPSKPSNIYMPLLKTASNYDLDTVYSGTGSQNLDMDFGVDSVHFSTDDFHFDESHESL